ncbi:MAG: putative porin [bacterium]
MLRLSERIGLRLDALMKVTDGVKAGARLVTGGDDPRSTNQTLEDTFSTKGIQLDRAYVSYSPYSASTLLLGKFGDPLYSAHDLLWDSDLSFEGGAAQYEINAGENMGFFLNAGFFILDEYTKESDPMMYAIQPGMAWHITEKADFNLGVSYYKFSRIKGRTLNHSAGTNSLMDISPDPNEPNEVLKYDYNSWGVDAELTLNNIFMLPQIVLVGEYVKNTDSDIGSDDEGFLAGIKIGAPKIKAPGQWQAFYNYRRLEKDSFLDVFPDSDFYSDKTGVKGYEVILQYGLKQNVILGLDYYETRPITGSDGSIQNLLQVDLLFKF